MTMMSWYERQTDWVSRLCKIDCLLSSTSVLWRLPTVFSLLSIAGSLFTGFALSPSTQVGRSAFYSAGRYNVAIATSVTYRECIINCAHSRCGRLLPCSQFIPHGLVHLHNQNPLPTLVQRHKAKRGVRFCRLSLCPTRRSRSIRSPSTSLDRLARYVFQHPYSTTTRGER